jgi:hypothetical protein
MELTLIQKAAKQTIDEQGNPVVQIPLDLWDAFLFEQQGGQIAQINAVIAAWENEPENDMPDSWWDDFMSFVNENRFKLGDGENE